MAERVYTYDGVDDDGNPVTISMTGAEATASLEKSKEESRLRIKYSKMLVDEMAPRHARVQSEYDQMIRNREASSDRAIKTIIVLIAIVGGLTLATAVFSPSHKSSASYISRNGY